MDLRKQYNNFADSFSKLANQKEDDSGTNRVSRQAFYNHLDFITPEMKLLDLACGDGSDILYYKTLTPHISGIDASEELVSIAKKNCDADIHVGLAENIPFENDTFDIVLSKYAIMTSADMEPIFKEIHRVLKPGGIMMYLVTHPFRQYIEKRDETANYFEQKIVESKIFREQITLHEPTHTMSEFLNEFLFTNFDVQSYHEEWDPSAEKIDGKKYPGFFILKAKKRY